MSDTAPTSPFDWNTGRPSCMAKPAKCTASQASEFAQAKRLLKKPGRTPPLLSSKRDESKRSIVIRTQADADKTSRIKGRL